MSIEERLLVNQETAITAINAQVTILKELAVSVNDQFFEERKAANSHKTHSRHYIQPRIRDSEGAFTIHWVRYVPPAKSADGAKKSTKVKSSHIPKGKVNKYRYADGNLKRASHDDEEYMRLLKYESEFEIIRKSLVFLIDSRKYIMLHNKNIPLLEKKG